MSGNILSYIFRFIRRGGSLSMRCVPSRTMVLGACSLAVFSVSVSACGESGYLKPRVSDKVLEKAESRFNDGVELYQRRNYRAALRKFTSAEQLCPELFSTGYHVALVHRKMGDDKSATAQFKRLNERFAENIVAHNDLGVVYAGKSEKEYELLATVEFDTAIKNGENLLLGKEKSIPQVRHDLAMAYSNLGAMQLRNSRLADAEKSFRKATEHYPLGFFGQFGLGNCLFAMKNFGEAKTALRKAQQIEPHNDNVRIALAKCYLYEKNKNPRFALSELRKIKATNPPGEVLELFGDAHALLGNSGEAVKHYRRHLSLPGRSPQVLYKLGAVYYNNKDFQDAKKQLREFVKEVSDDSEGAVPTAYKLLGDIAREEKDYEAAVANYGKATELRGQYWSSYYGLAESYFHLERHDQARRYVKLILDGLPHDGNTEQKELREKASALLGKLSTEE